MNKLDEIIIRQGGAPDMFFPIHNGKLEVSSFKFTFPHAASLMYKMHDQNHAVDIKDGFFQILPNIKVYHLYIPPSSKEVSNEPKTKKSDAIGNRQKQFDAMLKKVELQKNKATDKKIDNKKGFQKDDEDVNDPKNKAKQTFLEKMKKEAAAKVNKIRKIERTLLVGWKHKVDSEATYTQMTGAIGGTKHVKVNNLETYSTLTDFKEMLLTHYLNKDNKPIFLRSTIQLGNFHEDIYTQFENEQGDCSYWDFLTYIRDHNSRFRIYFLTTSITVKTAPKVSPTDPKILAKLLSNSVVRSHHISTTISNGTNSHAQLASLLSQPLYTNNSRENAISLKSIKVNNSNVDIKKTEVTTGDEVHEIVESINAENKDVFKRPNDLPPPDQSLNSSEVVSEICYQEQNTLDTTTKQRQLEKLKNLKLRIPILDDVKVLTFKKTLGKGAQGEVKEGLCKGLPVAIKTVRCNSFSLEQEILREISLLSTIRHQNIVGLVAVCPNAASYHIVMEKCDGYSLFDIIHNENIGEIYQFSLQNVLLKHEISYQICLGISYLHNILNPPLIHRDIKPSNIMVSLRGTQVKICDLGMGKSDLLKENMLHSLGIDNCKGTVPYLAPELVLDGSEATIYADVWSLACTIAEIYMERMMWPYFHLMEIKYVYSVKTKPLIDIGENSDLKIILEKCLNYTYNERPNVNQILEVYNCLLGKK